MAASRSSACRSTRSRRPSSRDPLAARIEISGTVPPVPRLAAYPGEPAIDVGKERIEISQSVEAGVDPPKIHVGILVNEDVAEAREPV